MTWAEFRRLVTKHLSSEELQTLCFDLNVDYASLPGQGKSAKVRELIELLRRRNRMPELVSVLREWHPHITWDEVLAQPHRPLLPVTEGSRWWPALGVVGALLVAVVLGYRLFVPENKPALPAPTVSPSATGLVTQAGASAGMATVAETTPVVFTSVPTTTPVLEIPLIGYLLFSRYPVGEASKVEICTWAVSEQRSHCLPRAGFYADWPPDRSRIAFAQESVEGQTQLYRMDGDGTDLTPIPMGPELQNPRDPVWSADGERLAFVAETAAGESDIFTAEPEGQIRQITTNPKADFAPDWSPAAMEPARIVFVSWSESQEGRRMGIFTVVADESTPEETRQELFSIPAGAGLLGHPVWSPDGRSVAFIYDNEVTEICLRTLSPLHTPEPRCFGSAADRQGLVWSPDAAFVAYTAFSEDEGGWIELMDVTNGHTSVLLEQRGYQLLGLAWEK